MEKATKQLGAKQTETDTRITNIQNEHESTKEDLSNKIQHLQVGLDKLASHEDRITKLEDDMTELREELALSRDAGKVDYDKLCSKDEYLELLDQIKDIQHHDEA